MVEHDIRDALDGYNKRVVGHRLDRRIPAQLAALGVRDARLLIRDGGEVARPTTRLRHAPFNGVHFASGESEVRLAQAYAATERYYFDGKTPVTITFDVDFAGGTSGALRSSAVDKAVIATTNTPVVASGSSGRFTVARDKTFRFDWTMPKAAFQDLKRSVAVEGFAVSAFGQLGDYDLSEPSGFKVSVASYRGDQDALRTSARNISESTHMTPSADSPRFALAVRLGAGEVVVDASPHAWESFDFACTLSEVRKAPVVTYSAELLKLSEVEASDSQKVLLAMRALSDLAAGLAEGEPVFAIDELKVRTAHGNAAASMRVAIDKARMSAGMAAWTPADGFVMSGRASISRSLAARLVAAASGGEAAARDMIAQLAARGVLRENGSALEFDIAARDGVYMVNGVCASELAKM